MWRVSSHPTLSALDHQPTPSPKQTKMAFAPSLPSRLPNSAQDLELVSALMSMRRSAPKYQLSPLRHRPPVDTVSTFGPDSPTRIEESVAPLRPVHVAPPHTTAKQSMLSPHKLPPLRTHLPVQRPLSPLGQHVESARSRLSATHKQVTGNAPSFAGPANIRYTPEQRRDAVRRFKAKKMRRKNQSTAIRYQIRKRLADTRPRFRGRFSKPTAAGGGKSTEDGK